MNRSEPRRRPSLMRCRTGSVVVEAALMMPLLALAVVASIDVARYMQLSARADRVAAGVADMVSRADVIRDRPQFDAATRSTDIGVYFELARALAEPEQLFDGGGVVLRSVTGTNGAPTVNWTRAAGIGADTATARIAGLTMLPAGVPFVTAEITLPFRPLVLDRTTLLGAIGFDRAIYRRAVFRPRSGSLTALAPA